MLDKANIHILRDKAMDTMACYSLERLGQKAIHHGAKAYIGCRDVYYAAFNVREHNFLDDWYDYTSSKTIALINGMTFGEAHKRFQERAQEYLNIYNEHITHEETIFDYYHKTLKHNMLTTGFIGDKNATLL